MQRYLRFIRFYPTIIPYFRELGEYRRAISSIRRFDKYFSQNIFYLGPLRDYPRRYYPISGRALLDVGFKGEKTIEILTLKGQKEVLEKVKEWINKFDLAKTIKIKPLLKKKTLAEVVLKDKKQNLDFNLYDVGFGISQILPIIVEGFFSPNGSLLLIEQPEIHLHPKLQADMGDLLFEIAKSKNSNKKLIVETHSEHLLLRLQRIIAEKRYENITEEDMVIYYFNYGSEGSIITKISIDEFGQFKNWPKGFFEEDIEESYAITRAIIESKKKKDGGS